MVRNQGFSVAGSRRGFGKKSRIQPHEPLVFTVGYVIEGVIKEAMTENVSLKYIMYIIIGIHRIPKKLSTADHSTNYGS